eukprot:15195922-Alexandrium_andersonii.AAC.1
MLFHRAKEAVRVRGADVLDESPELLGTPRLQVVFEAHCLDVLDVTVGDRRLEGVAEASSAVGDLDEHAIVGL